MSHHDQVLPTPEKSLSQLEDSKVEYNHDEGSEPQYTHEDLELSQGELWSEYQNLSVWQTMKTFKKAAAICLAVTFSAATDGYQIGMNGNIIANNGFLQQFSTQTNSAGGKIFAPGILSAWGGAMTVGQTCGFLFFPFLTEKYGRKWTMYGYCTILLSSILCESFARSWPVWLIAKFLAGLGVGTMQYTIPSYVTEIAPVNTRGTLLMLYNFWFSVGSFFASLGLKFMNDKAPNDYLTPIYTQFAQVGVMILITLCIPETAYWCAAVGKHDYGRKVLAQVNGGVPGYNVDKQYNMMVKTIEIENAVAKANNRDGFWAIFKGVDGFRTFLTFIPLAAQATLGLSLFYNYSAYFFQIAGLADPFQATMIFTGVQLVVILVVTGLVDIFGRRIIFCAGINIMWLSCVLVGVLGLIKGNATALSNALVFSTCLWAVGLQFSGTTGWGYIGELPSARHRTRTAGTGVAFTNVIGTAISTGVPYMLDTAGLNWGLKTAWFYVGLGIPACVAVWFFMPETRGRSAAELDELFEKKVKPWRFGKTETDIQKSAKAQGLATA